MDYEEKHWILVEMGVTPMNSEAPTATQKGHVYERPSKQQRFDFTETIVVCAGEEQKEFVVHKNVLATSSSQFLNRMFSNEWRETREKRLSLPETRPEALEVYLHWIYTGIIVLEPEPAHGSGERRVELYLLGDYLDDMSFCEAIVEGLVELSCGPEHKLPSATAVRLAWSKTSVDNPLRAVIKELFLGMPIKSTVEALSNSDIFPYEFIVGLLSALAQNDRDYCKRSISNESHAQIREACKGFVRGADARRTSSSTGLKQTTANAT